MSITDTPGAEYLQRERGVDLCQLTATEREQLCWIENARGDEGALAAAVTDSAGGELVGVQLTYVTAAGRDSEFKPERRIYSGPLDWRERGLFRLEGNGERTFTSLKVSRTRFRLKLQGMAVSVGFSASPRSVWPRCLGTSPRSLSSATTTHPGRPQITPSTAAWSGCPRNGSRSP